MIVNLVVDAGGARRGDAAGAADHPSGGVVLVYGLVTRAISQSTVTSPFGISSTARPGRWYHGQVPGRPRGCCWPAARCRRRCLGLIRRRRAVRPMPSTARKVGRRGRGTVGPVGEVLDESRNFVVILADRRGADRRLTRPRRFSRSITALAQAPLVAKCRTRRRRPRLLGDAGRSARASSTRPSRARRGPAVMSLVVVARRRRNGPCRTGVVVGCRGRRGEPDVAT